MTTFTREMSDGVSTLFPIRCDTSTPPLASRTEHQKRRFVKIWGAVKPIYGSITPTTLPVSLLPT